MLVLSRHEGDGISFPDLDLSVEIVKIQGSRVQVGVKAPKEIQILRSELVGRSDATRVPAARLLPSERSLTLADEPSTMATQRLHAARRALGFAEKHLQQGDLARAELAMQQAADHLRPTDRQQADAVAYAAACPISAAISNSVSEPTSTYAVTQSTAIATSRPTVRPTRCSMMGPASSLAKTPSADPQPEGLAC
jgi:carbon storage regulator CsrA